MGLHNTAITALHPISGDAYLRSDGPLSPQDFIAARDAGLHLKFDPVQGGWVHGDAVDDLCAGLTRPGWPKAKSVVSALSDMTLRRWQNSDAEQFRALLDNPSVWRHLPNSYPGPISLEMARDLIGLSTDTQLHTVKAITSAGTPVGQVRLEYGGQDPELSYWLGEPFWGKGIASRAVATFTRACFEENRKLNHMIARVKPENTASLRVLEKAGFSPEGRSNASPDWIILRCDRPG